VTSCDAYPSHKVEGPAPGWLTASLLRLNPDFRNLGGLACILIKEIPEWRFAWTAEIF
jgi:hypothetical protein